MIWFALGVVYVVWGSTYFGIRIMARDLPGLGASAARFLIAGLILGLVLTIRRGRGVLKVTPRQFGSAGLVGVLLLTGGNGLLTIAESPEFALPSGVAALLIALTPLLLVGLRAVTGDRPRAATLIGIAIGLAGSAVLFAPGRGRGASAIPIVGGLLVLLGVLCWGGGSFATRWLPMPANPFVASVYEMLVGGIVLIAVAAWRGEPAPWHWLAAPASSWLALAYLIGAGSLLGFTAYVWLLHHAPISLVATYAYVNPVIALALGVLFAGEALSRPVLLASAGVVLGVVLVVSTERPRPRSDQA
jgi:drug/metabolite transporter (DMT)-like permease